MCLIFILYTGAPRHHNQRTEKVSQEKADSRSYIDIDATDPFKVPKNSHYMDQEIPNEFDKEVQYGRATVEGEEGTEGEGGPEEQPQQETPDQANLAGEGEQEQEQGTEGGEGNNNNASLMNQNLSSDLPPGITEKIDEIAKNHGETSDGKPIEINENELKNMMSNSAGSEGEN